MVPPTETSATWRIMATQFFDEDQMAFDEWETDGTVATHNMAATSDSSGITILDSHSQWVSTEVMHWRRETFVSISSYLKRLYAA